MPPLWKSELYDKERYWNGVGINILNFRNSVLNTSHSQNSTMSRSSKQACKNTLYKHHFYKSYRNNLFAHLRNSSDCNTTTQCHVLRQWLPLKVRRSRFIFPSHITKTAARSQITCLPSLDSTLLPAPGRIKGLPVGQAACTGWLTSWQGWNPDLASQKQCTYIPSKTSDRTGARKCSTTETTTIVLQEGRWIRWWYTRTHLPPFYPLLQWWNVPPVYNKP